jgi:hypothetical protein
MLLQTLPLGDATSLSMHSIRAAQLQHAVGVLQDQPCFFLLRQQQLACKYDGKRRECAATLTTTLTFLHQLLLFAPEAFVAQTPLAIAIPPSAHATTAHEPSALPAVALNSLLRPRNVVLQPPLVSEGQWPPTHRFQHRCSRPCLRR